MEENKGKFLKKELCDLLAKYGVHKFEIIYDYEGEAYGIKHKYTPAESILNFEARKHLLINKLITEGK